MDMAVSMRLKSDPMLLCACRGMLKPVLARLELGPDRVDAVVLAVDEAVTNAMRHSYEGRKDETVTIACNYDPEWIEIVVTDTGRTADPNRIARKQAATPNAREITPGGLGIQLMYDICDEVGFESLVPHGNRVSMRLRRNAGAGESPKG